MVQHEPHAARRGAGPDSLGAMPDGLEPPPPTDRAGEPIAVMRTFGFVDITGFTAFCERRGEQAAIQVLTGFRSNVREIAARRGVRVAKWLGDGVMLVSVHEGPIVATVVELVARCAASGLDTHAGIATGTVLLFEGDDYVGRPANLAARLCDTAAPGEILASELGGDLPEWVDEAGTRSVYVNGVGLLPRVRRLRLAGGVLGRPSTAASGAVRPEQ